MDTSKLSMSPSSSMSTSSSSSSSSSTSSSSSSSPTKSPTTAPPAPIYHFKILVPAAAAGRIIGKGGTTIAQLQKDAGARVKMSKASEFYPGTTERVCLISGPIGGILKINDFFMENFSSTSIKILVPNSTAGMIIGKGGSYIKQIKEESGAYVQISQKCTDFSLPERCVTVVGELENIRKACCMILNKIVEDVGSAFRDIRASSMTASMFSSSSPRSNSSSSPQLHQQPQSQPITATTTTSGMPSHLFSSTNNQHHTNNINNNNYHNLSHHNLSISTSPTSSFFSTSGHASGCLPNIVKSLTPDHLTGGVPVIGRSSLTGSISPPLLGSGGLGARSSPDLTLHQPQTSSLGNNLITPPVVSSLAATSSNNGGSGVTGTSTGGGVGSVWSDMNPAQIIETIKLVLRVSGYGEDAVSEISSAMSTLANYGVLGVGLGLL